MKSKKPHILYVDDEEMNLMIFRLSFEKDFEITTAISGKEALDIFNSQHIDVIITDQRMPKMTGIELLQKIHEINPNVPAGRMLLSGCLYSEFKKELIDELHLYKFIGKPFEADSLREDIYKSMLKK